MRGQRAAVPGAWWRTYAAKVVVTGVVLAGVVAGCSSQPAVARGSVTSCFQFGVGAIRRHVTVTAVPAACQGLSQIEVNVAVGRALQAAVAGLGMTLVFLGPGGGQVTSSATALAGPIAPAPATAAAAVRPGDDPPPVRRPPAFVVAAHITAACITILLAVLAAIGSG